mmetsp:Transcript_65239/g.175021  ORF Transcript_65239/g.175021 Transcript_65239/m.175021 type:complete len:124 (+) Transcript_65239:726-1097(+)
MGLWAAAVRSAGAAAESVVSVVLGLLVPRRSHQDGPGQLPRALRRARWSRALSLAFVATNLPRSWRGLPGVGPRLGRGRQGLEVFVSSSGSLQNIHNRWRKDCRGCIFCTQGLQWFHRSAASQ